MFNLPWREGLLLLARLDPALQLSRCPSPSTDKTPTGQTLQPHLYPACFCFLHPGAAPFASPESQTRRRRRAGMTLITTNTCGRQYETNTAAHCWINIQCTWDTTLSSTAAGDAISRNTMHHRFSSLVRTPPSITTDSHLLAVSTPTGAKKKVTPDTNSLKRWQEPSTLLPTIPHLIPVS